MSYIMGVTIDEVMRLFADRTEQRIINVSGNSYYLQKDNNISMYHFHVVYGLFVNGERDTTNHTIFMECMMECYKQHLRF
jgi:hypothetical protein